MTGYLLMVSLMIWPSLLLSQHCESDYILEAKQAIFTLDTATAGSCLELELSANPANGYGYYYQNYLHFIKGLLFGGKAEYERYLHFTANRLNSLRELNGNNPEYLFFLSSVNLQTSLLAFFNGDYWYGAKTFYIAHREIRQNQSIYPDYPGNRKIIGIMEVLLSSIPENREWLFDLLGMKGDRTGGLEKLKWYYADSDPRNRTESLLIYALASVYYEEDPTRAFHELSVNQDIYLASPIFKYVYALSARVAGQPDEARKMLERVDTHKDGCRIPFTDLLLGEILLSDPGGGAIPYLKRFADKYEGTNLKKAAWIRMSWYYYLEGEEGMYRYYRQLALTKGSSLLDQDKQAMSEAADTSEPNRLLLKARLLYDGNRYHESLNLLLGMEQDDLVSDMDRVEYPYRLARVYHAMGNVPEAKKYYRLVLDRGKSCPWYMVPYSALQLAELYENDGDYAAAERYYTTCLEWKKYPYSGSIGSRAREGLKRVADHLNE